LLYTLRDDCKVRTVACEGGPTLFQASLERGLIDQLNLTIAPYMFGGANAPTLTGLSREFLPASVHCSLVDMRVIDEECFLTYRIKRQRRRPSETTLRDAAVAQVHLRSLDKRRSFARHNSRSMCIRNCKCMRLRSV
jgi:hypothetical protein